MDRLRRHFPLSWSGSRRRTRRRSTKIYGTTDKRRTKQARPPIHFRVQFSFPLCWSRNHSDSVHGPGEPITVQRFLSRIKHNATFYQSELRSHTAARKWRSRRGEPSPFVVQDRYEATRVCWEGECVHLVTGMPFNLSFRCPLAPLEGTLSWLRTPNFTQTEQSTDTLPRRDGLFIIDLDNPLNLPAFLPQGGMSVSHIRR